MDRITRSFLWLTLIGPLHMIEQMFTSLEEFHMIRGQLAGYYALFDPSRADLASVILVTVVWTTVSCLFYALLVGGMPRLVVMGVFGVFGVTELHHVLEALPTGYDAGVLTAVPYAIVGAQMVHAVWQEWRRIRPEVRARGAVASLAR